MDTLRRRMHRWKVLLVSSVGLAVIAWGARHFNTGYTLIPPFTPVQTLASVAENGVTVRVTFERDRHGQALLAATYTPGDATSHLYSTDLPRAGIDGAGRPTLLELPPQPDVRVVGALIADQPIRLDHFAALNTSFPVYPDGPVTLRLPIDVPAHEQPRPIQISVTYMACSSAGFCLPPVEDKRVTVTIPANP